MADSDINKRSEILFYYDVSNANPNGDPLDENKPRIDEQTGVNLVTDVRLKRTIRDYLNFYKNETIFVKEEKNEDGINKTREEFFDEFGKDVNKIIEKCIDIRLFGATFAIKKDIIKKTDEGNISKGNISLTGPVQFRIGQSKHQVNYAPMKGTTVLPSGKGKGQGTFRMDYVLPYSFIEFAGIINEFAAKKTKLTEADVKLLFEGMWEGTKCLISRSKFGQQPRLLIKINYKTGGFHIGDLDKTIQFVSKKPDLEIRSMADFELDCKEFSDIIRKNMDQIDSIELKKDPKLKLNNLDIATKELKI